MIFTRKVECYIEFLQVNCVNILHSYLKVASHLRTFFSFYAASILGLIPLQFL